MTVSIVITLALLQACDPVLAEDSIGVTKVNGGDVEVLYVGCPGELVQDVQIEVDVGPSDQEMQILWRITSDGSSATAFVVGETPPGFIERTPLDRSISAAETLLAVVKSSEFFTDVEFVPSELPSGLVLNGHYKTLSRAAFEARAKANCPSS